MRRVASIRGRSSAILFAVIAPVSAFLVAGSAQLHSVDPHADRPAGTDSECCLELVSAPPKTASFSAGAQAGAPVAGGHISAASRWRLVDVPRLLSIGVAPERGLQVRTILAARSVSAEFPEIQNIGGVRPDALRWHPNGLAIDVMIPNAGTPGGIALGNKIVAYALANADRFALQDAIWRGTYYTPGGGAKKGSYGHYDHVHLTTTGGGYPTGGEVYYR